MVISDGEISYPVDPLVGYSSFSLFPRCLSTSNYSSSTALFTDPNSPNLISLRAHFNSLAVRSADKLVNQAKTILADSSDLLKADKTATMASEDSMESSLCVNEENPQVRRPGLGLKRAKFSMKPMLSQPNLCMEPSIDIEKLEDPDVFFAAFDRMENAKKELQILKGEPLQELDQNRASLAPRHRRPGLFGFRKPVTYKHHPYPSLSQEALSHDKLSSTREDLLSETNFVNPSPPARVSDVSSTMNSKISELDELLSFNYDGLDEAGVQNFLQQKLNIKSIDIGRPSFPDLPVPDIHDRAIDSSSEALSALHDTIFIASDRNELAVNGPLNYSNLLRENSTRNQQSPTSSKSPLAAISLLNRKISKVNSSKDPYSSLDIDASPDIISYRKAVNVKQANQADRRDDLHELLRSLVNGEDTTGYVISSPGPEGDIGWRSNESKEWLDEGSKGDQIMRNEDLRRSPGLGEQNIAAEDVDPITGPIEQEDQIVGAPKSVQQKMFNASFVVDYSDINGGESGISESLNARVIFDEPINEKMVRLFESKSKETEESTVPSEENVSEEIVNRRSAKGGKAKSHAPGLKEPSKTISNFKETEESAVPSEGNVSEEIVNQKAAMAKGKSKAPVLGEPVEKKRKVGCQPGQSKANDKKRSKADNKQRRSSLYGAGTHWEAGVRRSSRIRMRPLEYWKGERFLYGRVHESMVSVIGVKYASPTCDSKQPALKVKSFVSDEYKDIVELASYY